MKGFSIFCSCFVIVYLLLGAGADDEVCGDYWFRCSDDTCVIAWEFCDGESDCSDGSDEVKYNESLHTSADGVPCRNQHNIDNVCLLPHDQQEKSFICRKDATCARDYLCSDGSGCIDSSWFCNGYRDCSDGSDEILFDPSIHSEKNGIPCRNSDLKRICLLPQQQQEKETLVCTGDATCGDGYLCANGRECIESFLFCNGETDCSDGSDEIYFDTSMIQNEGIICRQFASKYICLLPEKQVSKEDLICAGDESCADGYLCQGGGECIHEFSFCDGIPDCRHGEDELKYDASVHSAKDGIQCRNIFSNSICLLPRNQEEKSANICSGRETCELGFSCKKGGECIDVERFCDGKRDCSDGSDEISYNSTLHKNVNGIPCRQSWGSKQICLLRKDQREKKDLVCSGDASCGEGYLCSDGSECITGTAFCDGDSNCKDGSDETAYAPSTNSKQDGVMCRGIRLVDKICLLPEDQADKKDFLCSKDATCSSGYLCSDGVECIDDSEFCDMKIDCRDGSDEIQFNSALHTVGEGVPCQIMETQLICLLPVHQSEKRDQFCATGISDITCSGGYMCQNGWECIKIQNFCDGSFDCSDGSDEFLYESSGTVLNEGKQCRRSDSKYICLLPNHQLGKEITICTGDASCAGGFLCANGRECIEDGEFCDGWNDCSDSSDELKYVSEEIPTGGIACPSKKYFRDVCMLPRSQEMKAKMICSPDASCDSGYICSNGKECIESWMFCNGQSHCSDGSDEIRYNSSVHKKSDGTPCRRIGSMEVCLLPKHQATKRKVICKEALECASAYLCSDGSECVSADQFCNGQPQCSDGSDELAYSPADHGEMGVQCRSPGSKNICLLPFKQEQKKHLLCDDDSTCANGYLCLNARECIDVVRFCDGVVDCSDGSDEISPDIEPGGAGIRCRRGYAKQICLLPETQLEKKKAICTGDDTCEEFLCASGDECVSEDWFCDGTPECSDKSDEIVHDSANETSGEMACRSRRHQNKFCLLPSNQEWKMQTCKRAPPCHDTLEFACSNGLECIGYWMFCDGISDCSDNSDEQQHDSSLRKSDDKLSCRNKRYNDNMCILPPDQAMKKHAICAEDTTCKNGFLCSGGNECIPASWFCDGTPHCSDGSDELMYDPYVHTQEDGLPCRSKQDEKYVCLLSSHQSEKVNDICKIDDCGEDFRCSDGNFCINSYKFCDKIAQCSDKSDEVSFDVESGTSEDLFPCRSKTNNNEFCLLHFSQIEKINSLCRADEVCEPTEQYACANGLQCVRISSFCNGEVDCSDGSDEVIYNTHHHSLKDGVVCRSKRFRFRICLLTTREAHKEKLLCRPGF